MDPEVAGPGHGRTRWPPAPGRSRSRGPGFAVPRPVLERTGAQDAAVRPDVQRGSADRRRYERHGHVVGSHDPVDVFMTRSPGAMPGAPASP